MGRKRIPEEDRIGTVCINLKNSVIAKIAADSKDGKAKKKIEEIISQMYDKE